MTPLKLWYFVSLLCCSLLAIPQAFAMTTTSQTSQAQQLIDGLGLQAHVEGGYYKRTFQSDHRDLVATDRGERFAMTSIFYLLTAQSPVGHFHKNHSDIMHVFQKGDPLTYYLIYPDGRLETRTLGPDITQGHELQFVVQGGVWKASELVAGGDFGLITEVVVPGFDFADMSLADVDTLAAEFPAHKVLISRLAKRRPSH